jgi:hypothetical protein
MMLTGPETLVSVQIETVVTVTTVATLPAVTKPTSGGQSVVCTPATAGAIAPRPEMGDVIAHERVVTLTIEDGDRSLQCNQECKDNRGLLRGTVERHSVTGIFTFCGLRYHRSECIYITANSREGLTKAVTPRVCIDHNKACVGHKDTKAQIEHSLARVVQAKPFGPIMSTLYDCYGNVVKNCKRFAGEDCVCTIQEKPSCVGCLTGDLNYTQGGNREPKGTLRGSTPDMIRSIVNSQGKISYNNLIYNRGRNSADPLHLEVVCDAGGKQLFPPEPVQPFVVKGLRLQCVDSPQSVTAGESFDILAEVAKWSKVSSEYEIIDCEGTDANTKCNNTYGFMSICDSGCGGHSISENLRFGSMEVARGSVSFDGTTSDDCALHPDQATCDNAPLCHWSQLLVEPFKNFVPSCWPLQPRGVRDTQGLIQFNNLVYYKAGKPFVPSVTPRSPLIAKGAWLADASGDAPGNCDPVVVVPNIPYELCMGSAGCEKCTGNGCGACPIFSFAGAGISFTARVHDEWGNLIGPYRSKLVTVSCRVTRGPQPTPDQYYDGIEARLYPYSTATTRIAPNQADGTNGVARIPAEGNTQVRIAGDYDVTCWADAKVSRVGGDAGKTKFVSGLPNEAYDGHVVWTPAMGYGEIAGEFDVGANHFEAMFRASPNKIVRFHCAGCTKTHRNIYFRAYEAIAGTYAFMHNFTTTGEQGVDFDLFSSYMDALDKRNPWPLCSQNSTIGFPGNCGPGQNATEDENQWASFGNELLDSLTRASADAGAIFFVETAAGCSEKVGLPVHDESLWHENLGQTRTLAECVSRVKTLRSGLDWGFGDFEGFSFASSVESRGATWIETERLEDGTRQGWCYAEYPMGGSGDWSNDDNEVWRTTGAKDADSRTCGFPTVNKFSVGAYGCVAGSRYRVPCSAPPSGPTEEDQKLSARLSKTCSGAVLPSRNDHLHCINRPEWMWAGDTFEVDVSVRDRFLNRVTGLSAGTVTASSDPEDRLIPTAPKGPISAGVADVEPMAIETRGLTKIFVEADITLDQEGPFECVAPRDPCIPVFPWTCGPYVPGGVIVGPRPCCGLADPPPREKSRSALTTLRGVCAISAQQCSAGRPARLSPRRQSIRSPCRPWTPTTT